MVTRKRKPTIEEAPVLRAAPLLRVARERPQGRLRWTFGRSHLTSLTYELQDRETLSVAYSIDLGEGPREVTHVLEVAYVGCHLGGAAPLFCCPACDRRVRARSTSSRRAAKPARCTAGGAEGSHTRPRVAGEIDFSRSFSVQSAVSSRVIVR